MLLSTHDRLTTCQILKAARLTLPLHLRNRADCGDPGHHPIRGQYLNSQDGTRQDDTGRDETRRDETRRPRSRLPVEQWRPANAMSLYNQHHQSPLANGGKHCIAYCRGARERVYFASVSARRVCSSAAFRPASLCNDSRNQLRVSHTVPFVPR